MKQSNKLNQTDDSKLKSTKSKKTRRAKINLVFNIVDFVLIFALFVSIMIDNRVQSNEKFFSILTLVLCELILILMFVRNLLIYKGKKKAIISVLGYIVNAGIFALKLFIAYDDMLCILFIYNSIFALYLIIDFILYKVKHQTVKFFDNKMILTIALMFF